MRLTQRLLTVVGPKYSLVYLMQNSGERKVYGEAERYRMNGGLALLASWCLVLCAATAFSVLAKSDSLWVDELTSYRFSSGRGFGSVLSRMIARADPHPPGYQLLLFVYLKVVGLHGHLAVRGMSIACYVMTSVCGALLARRISGSSAASLAFVVLLTTANSTTYYATELRSYMSQQAALMALLLASELRRDRSTAPRHLAEQCCAFYLACSHYVGALLVGLHMAISVVRLWRRGARGPGEFLVPAGYLLGPGCAAIWLVAGPDRSEFRNIKVPSIEDVLGFFVDAVGAAQFAAIALVLGCCSWALLSATADRDPTRSGTSGFSEQQGGSVAERTGFLSVACTLVTMVILLPIEPVLQARSVLVLLPTLYLSVAVVIASALKSTRVFGRLVMGACGLLLFLGYRNFDQELSSPTRSGSDFRAMAKLANNGPLVANSTDLANKLRDASTLAFTRPRKWPVLDITRKSVANVRADLIGAERFYLACPHCRSVARKQLEELRDALPADCKKKRPSKSDLYFECRLR